SADFAEVKSGKSARNCRISFEQDRALMRILKLTAEVEKELLAARRVRDVEAERAATEIVADVRKRGDAALFEYTRKFDNLEFDESDLRIDKEQMREALKRVSPEFLRAIRQASRNIRKVAEKQLPKPWSLRVERGVHIRQQVTPIESIGCYVPGGR